MDRKNSGRVLENVTGGRIPVPGIQVALKREADQPLPDIYLPEGFAFAPYRGSEEDRLGWADIMCSAGFFGGSIEEGLKKFEHEFGSDPELAKRRVWFIKTASGFVGSCAAWEDYNLGVNVVHWMAVRPEYQDYGLGRALIRKVLWVYSEETPGRAAYLTTDTNLISALCLYLGEGFYPVYGDDRRKEKYEQAVSILKDVLREPCRGMFLERAKDERGVQLF